MHKAGNWNNGAKYHPISLTSTIYKTSEHIISSHILRHFENYNILICNQHRLRRETFTVTQLAKVVLNFTSEINNRVQTNLIFLDFSKALDRVYHFKLIDKLHKIIKNDQI